MKSRHALLSGVVIAVLTMMVACAQTDSGLTAKVKAKLASDSLVSAGKIDVDTKDKVVTLTGNLNSEDAKNRAIELARTTEGVVRVVDMIEVRTSETTGDAPDPKRTAGEVIDDAGITMRVKSKLLDDPTVKGLQIDVDTRNGVVFLTGTVTSQAEKDQAIRLAKATDGVKNVEANLTIGRG